MEGGAPRGAVTLVDNTITIVFNGIGWNQLMNIARPEIERYNEANPGNDQLYAAFS